MVTLSLVLEHSTDRVQFSIDKFQQLSKIQGLICIVSNVGVPKVVSAFRIIKGPHLRDVRASAFTLRGIQDLR